MNIECGAADAAIILEEAFGYRVSFATLNHYKTQGFCVPTGSEPERLGRSKMYTFDDVVHLACLLTLKTEGVSLGRHRGQLKKLREEIPILTANGEAFISSAGGYFEWSMDVPRIAAKISLSINALLGEEL